MSDLCTVAGHQATAEDQVTDENQATAEHQAATEHPPATEVRLTDDERQPCEVWTRVMGYHRPVASFNVGKQGEHNERRFFAEPGRIR